MAFENEILIRNHQEITNKLNDAFITGLEYMRTRRGEPMGHLDKENQRQINQYIQIRDSIEVEIFNNFFK